MTCCGNWLYTYDLDGNRVDGDDRLIQVSKGEILEDEFAVDYIYDETGNLPARATGVDVTFVWDGLDLLSEALDRLVSAARLDGRVGSFLLNGDFDLVQCDALCLTVANGEVLDRFEYGAWGELLPGSFDSVGLALRFVGGYGVRTDLETGLLWMRHRWYDATLQRFISRDPIGLEGGANLYAYAEAMPQNVTDEMGLKTPFPRTTRPQGTPTRAYISPQMQAEMMRVSPAGYRAVMGAGQFNIPVRPGWGPGSLPGSTQQQSGPSPQAVPFRRWPFPLPRARVREEQWPERMRRCEMEFEFCIDQVDCAVKDVRNSHPEIVIVQDPETGEKLKSIEKKLKKECHEALAECLRTPRFIVL